MRSTPSNAWQGMLRRGLFFLPSLRVKDAGSAPSGSSHRVKQAAASSWLQRRRRLARHDAACCPDRIDALRFSRCALPRGCAPGWREPPFSRRRKHARAPRARTLSAADTASATERVRGLLTRAKGGAATTSASELERAASIASRRADPASRIFSMSEDMEKPMMMAPMIMTPARVTQEMTWPNRLRPAHAIVAPM